MQSSSLIFVLVVAIWAVYLLQYWIRRRDHLSTVRSVDRFSAAMRILDHHRLRGEAADPTPRSYAVAPTRGVRPEITVKHAQRPRRQLVEPVVGVSRKTRGLTLLTLLALLPVVIVVAAVGPLSWWVALAWLVGTIAAFGWLRQGVRAEREARDRAHAHAHAQRRPGGTSDRFAGPAVLDTRNAVAAPTAEPALAPRDVSVLPARPRRDSPIYDVAESTRTTNDAECPAAADPVTAASENATTEKTTTPAAGILAPPPAPGTWQPTRVPRPMYTLKAKAPRAQPTPFEGTPGQTPQVIDVEDEELPAVAGWG